MNIRTGCSVPGSVSSMLYTVRRKPLLLLIPPVYTCKVDMHLSTGITLLFFPAALIWVQVALLLRPVSVNAFQDTIYVDCTPS